MTEYFSKSKNSTSEVMKQAVQEIKFQNLSARVEIEKSAHSLICSRQISVQEAVYLCLPELWLRKCQPGVVWANKVTPNWKKKLLEMSRRQQRHI